MVHISLARTHIKEQEMTVDVRELDAKLVTHEINVTDYLEWLDETGHTETLEQVERFALSLDMDGVGWSSGDEDEDREYYISSIFEELAKHEDEYRRRNMSSGSIWNWTQIDN